MQWFRVFYFIILRILSELYDIIVRESLPNLGPCFSFIPLIAILATFFQHLNHRVPPLDLSSDSEDPSESSLITLDHLGWTK